MDESNLPPALPQLPHQPPQVGYENHGDQPRINIAVLREQQDSLLQPDLLRLVTDIQTVEREVQSAVAAGDRETAQFISDIHEEARRRVLGPERAVSRAQAMNRETAKSAANELSRAAGIYDGIARDVGGRSGELYKVGDMASQFDGLLRELQEIGRGSGQLTQEHLTRAGQLRAFADEYTEARRSVAESTESTAAASSRGGHQIGEAQRLLSSGQTQIRDVIDETLEYPDLANLDETLQRVAQRGAATVGEHVIACQADATREEDAVGEAAKSASDVMEGGYNVKGAIDRLQDEVQALPLSHVINGHVDYLLQVLSAGVHNGSSLRNLWEPIGELQRALAAIQKGAGDIGSLNSVIVQEAQAVSGAARQLGSLPLFASAPQ